MKDTHANWMMKWVIGGLFSFPMLNAWAVPLPGNFENQIHKIRQTIDAKGRGRIPDTGVFGKNRVLALIELAKPHGVQEITINPDDVTLFRFRHILQNRIEDPATGEQIGTSSITKGNDGTETIEHRLFSEFVQFTNGKGEVIGREVAKETLIEIQFEPDKRKTTAEPQSGDRTVKRLRKSSIRYEYDSERRRKVTHKVTVDASELEDEANLALIDPEALSSEKPEVFITEGNNPKTKRIALVEKTSSTVDKFDEFNRADHLSVVGQSRQNVNDPLAPVNQKIDNEYYPTKGGIPSNFIFSQLTTNEDTNGRMVGQNYRTNINQENLQRLAEFKAANPNASMAETLQFINANGIETGIGYHISGNPNDSVTISTVEATPDGKKNLAVRVEQNFYEVTGRQMEENVNLTAEINSEGKQEIKKIFDQPLTEPEVGKVPVSAAQPSGIKEVPKPEAPTGITPPTGVTPTVTPLTPLGPQVTVVPRSIWINGSLAQQNMDIQLDAEKSFSFAVQETWGSLNYNVKLFYDGEQLIPKNVRQGGSPLFGVIINLDNVTVSQKILDKLEGEPENRLSLTVSLGTDQTGREIVLSYPSARFVKTR